MMETLWDIACVHSPGGSRLCPECREIADRIVEEARKEARRAEREIWTDPRHVMVCLECGSAIEVPCAVSFQDRMALEQERGDGLLNLLHLAELAMDHLLRFARKDPWLPRDQRERFSRLKDRIAASVREARDVGAPGDGRAK